MRVNNLYQPWRAILSLINQCLIGKTYGNDKPRHLFLQMLLGIVTRTNVDYAELLWEEFVQAIHIFFAHQTNLNVPTKKPTPHVSPYFRFTKLIIFYLGSVHNIHRRPGSPVHVTRDDYLLGNLKFVPKGEKDEVFGKPIPKTQKPSSAKQSKPAAAKQTKPVKEKTTQPSTTNKIRKGKVVKIRKGKSSLQLVDEDEEVQHEPEPQIEDDEYNLQQSIQMSLESFQAPIGGVAIHEPTIGVTRSLPVVEGKEKGIATDEQVAQSLREVQQPKGKSTTDQYIFQRRTLVTMEASTGHLAQPEDDTFANIVCDTPSPPDAETGVKAEMFDSEGDTEILNVGEEKNEDKAGSNLGPSHVALAGPNPETMYEDFIAIVYPKVHESLKYTTEEHVFLENPPSLPGTLSSMKNLDDAFTYGDQFLNDKPTEEELGKVNLEAEVESMVTIPIHQASSTVPPLSTSIIDLTPPKPVSPPIQEPIFTATTITTTTLPPPPPQQQSTADPALAARIDKYINENVKKGIQNALKAPVHERFEELLEFEMKEILRDRMFKSGSYRLQPEHTALYEALEASMDRENREEFVDATTKSCKRRRDDQDPPSPPSKDLDQNKKKRHDSDTSASKQTQA
ncbi:hypothetical protein Tco_0184652 [Tanacetum coccineum]